ncbi:hypothetical protein PV327_000601 [Microctonus hyperodae]|uniref:Uncharacterized protein n=1 Tax=Microctonus hyperodae TaxID=165561 RepID=A0AA39G6I3_MICHY|nr:hypothetical protein PV327_000601 [Microctonus hyperodae]
MQRVQLLCLAVLLTVMAIYAAPNNRYDGDVINELNNEEYENNSFDDFENMNLPSARCGRIGHYCTQTSDCCPKLRCHSYLAKCVT